MMPWPTVAAVLIAALADASVPHLLRKEQYRSPTSAMQVDSQAEWSTFQARTKRLAVFGGPRAPSGHHVDHLAGFDNAFAEMQALTTSPPEVFFTSTPPPAEVPDEVVQEQCASAGPLCRKVVDFLAERVPVTTAEKLELLCGPAALDCVAQHMDKCGFFHAQVVRLQNQWSCEALSCSARGKDCQKAVQLLEMDDHQLTPSDRQQKTRFLCSDEGLKCITDHKDSCISAYEIVSMAHDLRHCDRVRCSDAGAGCERAVQYLTQDDLGNLTHHKTAESRAKWDYLCSEESLTCLEENGEKCQRYLDFLKSAFGDGQCNFVQCAKAGPDCKRAVMYLSQADAEHSAEELAQKHTYLCGPSSAACLAENEQCSPYSEMLKQMKATECVEKHIVKATMPPTKEILDARSDAVRAAAEAVVKAHASPSTARKAAEIEAEKRAEEAQKQEEQRILAKAAAISEGRDPDEPADKDNSQEAEKKEDKKGSSLIIGVAVVCLAVGGGVLYWRRRKAAKGAAKFEKGVPPKPKKPVPAKLRGKGSKEKSAAAEKSAEEEDQPAKGVVAGTMARFKRFANLASATSFASRFRKSKDAKADDKPDDKAGEPSEKGEDSAAQESPKATESPEKEKARSSAASAKEEEEKAQPPAPAGSAEPPLPPPSQPATTAADQAASDKDASSAAPAAPAIAAAEASSAAPAEAQDEEPREY